MGLIEFKNVLRFVKGEEPTEEEKQELFKEVALMTLARATSADTNIKTVELEAVQQMLKRMTGETFSLPDIQIAAQSEIFERKPLDKYLSSAGRKLDTDVQVLLERR